MTSAARPTFAPARGSNNQGGSRLHAQSKQFSAKDLPGYTTLKMRRPGQGTSDELKEKNFREVLEEKERKHFDIKRKEQPQEEEEEEEVLRIEAPRKEKQKDLDNIDADDTDSSDSDSSDDSDSESDDDETAELMRELEKIKKERAEEEQRRKEQQDKEEEEARDNAIRFGNPLLNQGGGASTFNVKKRWYDDVVFKNQAKDEPKKKKRFINDTIRNDFHRKFLSKYIQ